MLLFIAAAALVVVAFWLAWTFNRLVRLRKKRRKAWSGIDVQLKRRHDLVPALVEAVKGYKKHEESLLKHLVRTRREATSARGIAETADSENTLSSDLRALFAVAEAYPDLKADKNFRQLRESLVAIENDLQNARRHYNDVVRDHNDLVESFPSMIAAKLFGYRQAESFEIGMVTEGDAQKIAV